MPLFEVDPDLCLRDGICVDECPRFLIEMPEDGWPAAVPGMAGDCIACGHCVAVCPTGALMHERLTPVDCAPLRPELLPTASQTGYLLRSRRSVRTFEPRAVPREQIERLLRVACYAPSAGNGRPVAWLVVYDTALVRRLTAEALAYLVAAGLPASYRRVAAQAGDHGADLVARHAPHLVIAHTPAGKEVDGVIALAQFELIASAEGLGVCWSGFFNRAIHGSPALRKALGLPAGQTTAGVLLLGFPRYTYPRIPPRDPGRVDWL